MVGATWEVSSRGSRSGKREVGMHFRGDSGPTERGVVGRDRPGGRDEASGDVGGRSSHLFVPRFERERRT